MCKGKKVKDESKLISISDEKYRGIVNEEYSAEEREIIRQYLVVMAELFFHLESENVNQLKKAV